MPNIYKDESGQWWHRFADGRRVRCSLEVCEACGRDYPTYRPGRFCSRACTGTGPRKTAVERAMIAQLYAAGAPMREISSVVGVSETTALAIARAEGACRPTNHRQSPFSAKELERATELYEDGLSLKEIGAALGTSESRTSRELKRAGVFKRYRGRHLTQDGYVRVPDPTGRRKGVLEHRLVMSQSIGRELLPHETVHHIDGNRSNNDIANLELWVGRHGKGASAPHCASCSCFPDSQGGP